MRSNLTIKEVMTPAPHAVAQSITVEVAMEMMREHNIRHLPVRDGGRIVGLISERDLNFALRVDRVEPSEMLVRDVFYPEPYCVAPNALVSDVSRKMAQEHYGCALIVEAEELVGIFTTVDACRVLADTLG